MQAELRRYQEISRTSGFGVLIFCIWAIVKAVMLAVLQQDAPSSTADWITPELEAVLAELSANLGRVVLLAILLLVFVVLELIFRIYVGKTAMAVARGKKKRPVYLVLAVILAVFYIFSIYLNIRTLSYIGNPILDTVITFVIDLTSFGTLIALIVSGIQIRKLEKRITLQEEAACR